jgi:antitoxin component YwqK of YwqJK toxin-antitoxin module
MKLIAKTTVFLLLILSISCTLAFGAEESYREGIARRVKKLQADLEIFKKIANNDQYVCIDEYTQNKYKLNEVETKESLDDKVNRYLSHYDDATYGQIMWSVFDRSAIIKKEIREKTIPGIETKLELIQLALYSARENGSRQDQETETNDGTVGQDQSFSDPVDSGVSCPEQNDTRHERIIPENHQGTYKKCQFFANGILKREWSYRNNILNGVMNKYMDEPQHRLTETGMYKDGSPDGLFTRWMIDKSIDHYYKVNEIVWKDHKQYRNTHWHSNGEKSNESYYYSNGKMSEFREWSNKGKLISCVNWDHFGKKTYCMP